MDFQKRVDDLKQILPLKNTTDVGDTVIVMASDMLLFGVVTSIDADKTNRKGDWWHIGYTIIGVPLIPTTIILRTEQMTGLETFTVEGEWRFFAAVDFSKQEKIPEIPTIKDKPKIKSVSKFKPRIIK